MHATRISNKRVFFQTKSDVFAEIRTTDTEAKSKIQKIESGKVVSWSSDIKGHAENAWNAIGNWREQISGISYYEFQHTVWTIIDLREMMSKPQVDWPMYVLQLFLNICTSHESVDHSFYGQYMH